MTSRLGVASVRRAVRLPAQLGGGGLVVEGLDEGEQRPGGFTEGGGQKCGFVPGKVAGGHVAMFQKLLQARQYVGKMRRVHLLVDHLGMPGRCPADAADHAGQLFGQNSAEPVDVVRFAALGQCRRDESG